ncbi:8-amino-7-oxononanoate synthase [Amylocarpus encephaloides]|uniref:8-amino-7-oxononanoate synthase n=1 Tax=Amylocarpus encephaloides TaxID=45428 RepID=A0A9P7YHX0_9HELO|nr:8-amino-7-oxononanoate synthase [Amylocarpus encephaloides]
MAPSRSPLENTLSSALSKRESKSVLRALTTTPQTSIDFSSNSFLSLSTSLLVKEAFLKELSTNPSFQLGSGGSRLLDGNTPYAEALEQQIARFHNADSALLFNSGYDANSGFFGCIPQNGDVVIYDEYIHASVREGLRLSRASESFHFIHNDLEDLSAKLENTVRHSNGNVFVAVESLYSMDGDLAPLREIAGLVERICHGRGCMVVDEAHSNAMFGDRGQGCVHEARLESRVFARLHTFGKGVGASGAALLCSKVTREYLINYARPLIYTTAMSFPSLAAIKVVYDLMESGGTQPLLNHLQSLTSQFHSLLRSLPSTTLLTIPPIPQSPIFSLLTPRPRVLAKYCQERGFVVRAIVSPTVPVGTERVRVCLHAGNTFEEVEGLMEVLREWVQLTERKRSKKLAEKDVEEVRNEGPKARL